MEKPTSRNSIAIALAKEFQKSARTCWSWFDRGCPATSLEDARDWALANSNKKKPPKAVAAVAQVKAAPLIDNNAPVTELIEKFPEAVQIAVAMREAGVSMARIASTTGFSNHLVSKLCREHPNLAPQEKSLTQRDWQDVRRLSVSRLKELLENDEAAAKFKPMELASVAGISHDKLEVYEAPQSHAINIRAKIMAMSHDELIAMIKKPTETIEAEVTPIPPTPGLPIPSRNIPFQIPMPEAEVVEVATE